MVERLADTGHVHRLEAASPRLPEAVQEACGLLGVGLQPDGVAIAAAAPPEAERDRWRNARA
jgi:hypothetical protein